MKPQQALLLVDIQNDYFEGGNFPLAGSLEASLNAKRVLEFFRERKMPVFHIRHIADACATKDLEIFDQTVLASDVHAASLAAMSFFYAAIKTTDDFLR